LKPQIFDSRWLFPQLLFEIKDLLLPLGEFLLESGVLLALLEDFLLSFLALAPQFLVYQISILKLSIALLDQFLLLLDLLV